MWIVNISSQIMISTSLFYLDSGLPSRWWCCNICRNAMWRWIFIMKSENSIKKEWKIQPTAITATTTTTTIIINNKSFHISSSYELLSFSIFDWRNEWFSFPFVWFCFVIICFRSNDSIYVMWCGSIHIDVWTVYNHVSFSFLFLLWFFLFGKIRIIPKHIISTQRFFLCNRLQFCFYFFFHFLNWKVFCICLKFEAHTQRES